MEINNGASRISKRFARRSYSRLSKIYNFVKVTVTIKKRIQRLIVAALTMVLVLTGFTFMPMATQIVNPDSDNGVVYAASKKVKVTFSANGGKFTEKKYEKKKLVSKKVTKGKKVGTLPKIKRTGYTFKGWYTKKSGGKTISKKTIASKKITFYAQWKKKAATTNSNRVLTAEEKSLVGLWGAKIKTKKNDRDNDIWEAWKFNADGTYWRTMTTVWFTPIKSTITMEKGIFSVESGAISCTSTVGHVETYDVGSEWYASWQDGKDVKPTKTTKDVSSSNKNWYYQIKSSLSDGLPVIIIVDAKSKMDSMPPLLILHRL